MYHLRERLLIELFEGRIELGVLENDPVDSRLGEDRSHRVNSITMLDREAKKHSASVNAMRNIKLSRIRDPTTSISLTVVTRARVEAEDQATETTTPTVVVHAELRKGVYPGIPDNLALSLVPVKVRLGANLVLRAVSEANTDPAKHVLISASFDLRGESAMAPATDTGVNTAISVAYSHLAVDKVSESSAVSVGRIREVLTADSAVAAGGAKHQTVGGGEKWRVTSEG